MANLVKESFDNRDTVLQVVTFSFVPFMFTLFGVSERYRNHQFRDITEYRHHGMLIAAVVVSLLILRRSIRRLLFPIVFEDVYGGHNKHHAMKFCEWIYGAADAFIRGGVGISMAMTTQWIPRPLNSMIYWTPPSGSLWTFVNAEGRDNDIAAAILLCETAANISSLIDLCKCCKETTNVRKTFLNRSSVFRD